MCSPDPGITREKAYEKAWKYVGYRNFSRFVGCDQNFFFIRQYRTLNARIILAMQDQILELENQLNTLDNDLSRETAPDEVHNGSYRRETSHNRLELIWNIQRRLKDYSMPYFPSSFFTIADSVDDYVNTYSQLATRPRVAARDIRSLKRWIAGWPNAILDEEMGYIDQTDDLVYVAQKSESSVNRNFKDFALLGRPWFRRYPKEKMEYTMENVSLHDEERAEAFFTRATMLLGLAMLIGPLWILESVSGPLQRLGVITSFILLFFILVSFITTAKPFESLAAAAG